MPDVSTDFNDLTPDQQDMLVAFLKENFRQTQGINGKHTAYGLKQKFTKEHFYLTQEQFTQAMEKAGFKVKPLKYGNASFNISERSPYFK